MNYSQLILSTFAYDKQSPFINISHSLNSSLYRDWLTVYQNYLNIKIRTPNNKFAFFFLANYYQIFFDIEIKYWACVIKYINKTNNFWIKMKNMRTADPHLGPPKTTTEAKSRPKCSPENRGPTTSLCARIRRGKQKGLICRGIVDPSVDFK